MPPPVRLPALIRQELDRLLDSDALRRAPSHMRLLRYLVERRVAGDDAALRETSIALEVFRRDPSTYDPQTDPIVRVTAGRLRDRLEAHYALFNATPQVRIVLPKGRYAPEFVAQSTAAQPFGLAVLRTRNQTGDAALESWCEAFADRLADHLIRAGLPRVMARGSVGGADASSGDAAVVGAQLGVPWLVESTLAREQERELRLSVRLVNASDAVVRWVDSGVSPQDDVHRLLDRMLDLVLVRLLETLPTPAALRPDVHARASLSMPQRVALERARLMVLQRTLGGADEAVALAESVARENPDSADAWAALGAALYSRLSFMDRDSGPIVEVIRAAVDQALALDAEHAVALRTKAIIVGKFDYDAAGAEQLFVRALRTLPHYTSARLNYAEILSLQCKFDEALAELNLARVYDPLSASVHLARAICLGYQRAFEQARDAWSLCRAAGDTSLWMPIGAGVQELAAGDLDAAQALFDEALERFPDLPTALIGRAYVHAARGNADDARALERQCLARHPHFSAANRAVLAAMLDDRAGVIALLAQARARHDMDLPQAVIHAAFDRYANDPQVVRLFPFGAWKVASVPTTAAGQ